MAKLPNSPLLIVASLIAGGLTGKFLGIDERMNVFGNYLKKGFKIGNERFTDGFVSEFLLFCMGTMSILGVRRRRLNWRNI